MMECLVAILSSRVLVDCEQWQHTIFRLRNDLYCVGWGVKLYSLTHWQHTIFWPLLLDGVCR